MSCKTCNQPVIRPSTANVKSELQKVYELAAREAESDQKVFVVVEYNGTYFHECWECRKKNTEQDGTVIAYVR